MTIHFELQLALRQDNWEVVESCKRFSRIADKRARLGAQSALTILSKEWFDLEDYGVTNVGSQISLPAATASEGRRPTRSSSSRPQEHRSLDLLTVSFSACCSACRNNS